MFSGHLIQCHFLASASIRCDRNNIGIRPCGRFIPRPTFSSCMLTLFVCTLINAVVVRPVLVVYLLAVIPGFVCCINYIHCYIELPFFCLGNFPNGPAGPTGDVLIVLRCLSGSNPVGGQSILTANQTVLVGQEYIQITLGTDYPSIFLINPYEISMLLPHDSNYNCIAVFQCLPSVTCIAIDLISRVLCGI